jgi:hypothetical protein
VETIAFYWEPIIRIYGFCSAMGLSLITLDIPASRMADLGQKFHRVGSGGGAFRAVFAQSGDMRFHVYLLVDREQVKTVGSRIETDLGGIDTVSIATLAPVDLIYFNGPHFGDRYGIADAVFYSLDAHSVPVLVSGFSGSVVYIVVPGGCGQTAETSLGEVFTVPGS